MEIGESIGETIVREVREAVGIAVKPEYIIGVHMKPYHIIAFSDCEIRQQFLSVSTVLSSTLQVGSNDRNCFPFHNIRLERNLNPLTSLIMHVQASEQVKSINRRILQIN